MIAYTTGSLSAASAAALGQAMAEKIRDDVVTHTAWDLVEEFTASSGAVNWTVFRCNSAASGLPSDFFVVMGRTIASGELRFAICEGYDSTTHTMSKFGAFGETGNVAYTVDGCNPATYVLGTAAFSSSINTPGFNSWTPSGTTINWWLCVAEDGFTAAFHTEAFVHVGAYTPLSTLAIALPLQIMGKNGFCWITRNPAVAGQTVHGFALTGQGGDGSSVGTNGPLLGFRGDIRYNDKLQADKRAVAEQGINVYQYDATKAAVYGYALGKQKRMRVAGGTAPAGFVFGDAYSIDGTLWVPYTLTDLRLWDTGVAA